MHMISDIASTTERDINIKARLFNALTAQKSEDLPYVNIIHHSMRATKNGMQDHFHPFFKSSGIFAGSLGRGVQKELWILPRYNHPDSSHGQQNFNISSYVPRHLSHHERLYYANGDLVSNIWC